jgi:hypothetical protein
MKKILSLLAFVAVLSVNAQTSKTINYPFGAAQAFTIATSGTTAVTVSNQMAYVSSVPTLTAAATISLTAASSLKAGAMVLVTVKTTSTEVTTLAGSVLAPTVTGAAGKTWSQAYLYNGTNFYPCGAKIQVD